MRSRNSLVVGSKEALMFDRRHHMLAGLYRRI